MTWNSINKRLKRNVKELQIGVQATISDANKISDEKFIEREIDPIDEGIVDLKVPIAKVTISVLTILLILFWGYILPFYLNVMFLIILFVMFSLAKIELTNNYEELKRIAFHNKKVFEEWTEEYQRACDFFAEQVASYGWHTLNPSK